jgi:hypothetical protein
MNWKLYSYIATVWFIFGFALCGRGQDIVRVYEGVELQVWDEGDGTVRLNLEEFEQLVRLTASLKQESKWSDEAVSTRDSVIALRTRMYVLQAEEMNLWRERVRVEVEMKAFYEKAWQQEKRGKTALSAKWGTIGGVVGGVVGFAGGMIVGSLR